MGKGSHSFQKQMGLSASGILSGLDGTNYGAYSFISKYTVHGIGVDKSISSKLSSFPFPEAKLAKVSYMMHVYYIGLGIAVGGWWLWLDLSTVG